MGSANSFFNISAALHYLTEQLSAISNTPRLDAELLIAHAYDRPRSFVYAHSETQLSAMIQKTLAELISRRMQGEPIAYLLGKKEFWSLELQLSEHTLIPRPETEHLVAWALERLPENNIAIAELGTGSGAIAITLAHERPQWSVHATDMSLAALKIAIQNAAHFDLDNIAFYAGDWCDALPHRDYAAIISNPPYLAPNDPHLAQLAFEPRSALVATENGLGALKKIISQAPHYLLPYGLLILEHGYNQSSQVKSMLNSVGFTHVNTYCDLAKQTRFTIGTYEP